MICTQRILRRLIVFWYTIEIYTFYIVLKTGKKVWISDSRAILKTKPLLVWFLDESGFQLFGYQILTAFNVKTLRAKVGNQGWRVSNFCYTIIQCKIELYVFILCKYTCKYTSVFMLHAGQLSVLVKCTSRLDGNN